MRRIALIALLILTSCTGNTGPAETTQPAALTTLPPATAAETSTTTTSATATTDTTTTTTTTTTTLPPNAAAGFALSQVVFGDLAFVVITNRGDAPGTTDGLWLTQGQAVRALPAVELAPGEQAVLGLGAQPPLDLAGMAAVIHIGPSLGPIEQTGGEVGLHNSDAFNDPNSLIAYVAWGRGLHAHSEEATEAGLWDGSSVEIIDETPSISTGIYPATHASDWAVDIGG
ncbi:MAG: hypothetical protein WBV06_08780 [Acidimicrobiia bacterium]